MVQATEGADENLFSMLSECLIFSDEAEVNFFLLSLSILDLILPLLFWGVGFTLVLILCVLIYYCAICYVITPFFLSDYDQVNSSLWPQLCKTAGKACCGTRRSCSSAGKAALKKKLNQIFIILAVLR